MLRQLRNKFILINMLLVSLILLTVFFVQFFSDARQVREETEAALRRTLEWTESGPDRWQVGEPSAPPDSGGPGNSPLLVPTFCVIFKGEETVLVDNNADISRETLTAALEATKGSSDSGFIPSLGLCYLRSHRGGEHRIAFADISWGWVHLRQHALTALLIGALALMGFFLVSLFLARWALRPVERSWMQQQQFIADASHELKTPLTVMLADADILLAHPEETIASRSKWVGYIREEAERMKELVENMLFLARGDSDPRDFTPVPVAMADLCWSCLLSFEPVAFERGAELTEEGMEKLTVSGDPDQLRRLVTILLDNACKYCGTGGSASLSLRRQGDRAVLTVCNTGEPIPAEALPHLFERFYRVDSSRDRASGGYGLGLSIAAAIVRRHRGRIGAESSAEKGTRFTVTLPLHDKAGPS